MSTKRIVAIVIGSLLVLIGLALLVPGVAVLGVYGTFRDESGFFQSSDRVVTTTGYALVSPSADLNMGPGDWQWVPTGGRAAVRIRASSTGSQPIFIGIGPSDKVAAYVGSVARDEVTDYGWGSTVKYRHFDGGAPSAPPGAQDFWVAKAEGTGVQSAEWDIRGGDWTAVVMNADGSEAVSASLSLGARFGFLLPIGIGITVVAVIFLGVGILLIVLGARRPRSMASAQPPAGYVPPPGWGQPQTGWTQPQAGWTPAQQPYSPPAPQPYSPPVQGPQPVPDVPRSGEPDPNSAPPGEVPPAE
jgi:hypothetical protein